MNLAPLVIDEVTVIGSRCGPFDRAIQALASERIDPRDMITARFPLADAEAALDAAAHEHKVVLDLSL
jgi:threonine dehydrogenase-like Zn-dependent dehydrogenase